MFTFKSLFKLVLRFSFLYVLFLVLFMLGSLAVSGLMPENATSEPGLLPDLVGLLVIAFADLAIICALVLTSRWYGWKLAVLTALTCYGAVTFVMQVETWYFLSAITVDAQLLPRLFLMGLPTAFIFIPAAIWILGKGKGTSTPTGNEALVMPIQQWTWKVALLVLVYIVLYWCAGYFIAWQNPELRAFYGQPGEILPFFAHTINTLKNDPWLFPFQVMRALLWIFCALPIIRGSKVNAWWTALMIGMFFSIPQNIGHLISNPLLPVASLRLSHLIETASSTFIFGCIVVWLLHRKHVSVGDLIKF